MLLHTAYCILHTAYCIHCILHTTLYTASNVSDLLLHTAYIGGDEMDLVKRSNREAARMLTEMFSILGGLGDGCGGVCKGV
jgi:hypothetical protein